jgi:mannose-1-phosphate guanylyltransferase/mannose-6-phosphate isomerase
MKHRIIPAIMSGGAGTRLWPLSTEASPKQFHALASARTLFAETAARVTGEAGSLSFAPPIVLCNVRHGALARAALDEAGVAPAAIVLEPAPRNTAAVAAVAAAVGAELDPDALVLLLSADHMIGDVAAFHAAIERAAPFALERILTFGVNPSRPATGYGYIKRGAQLGEGVYAIESFREKPDEATAQAYLAEGGYSWNSGMFLFGSRALLEAFDVSADIRDSALKALRYATRAGAEIRLAASFEQAPAEPFDTAVMEKATRAAVVPCDMRWADIGSWDEIWRLAPHDAAGNAVQGAVATIEASGNLLHAEGVKLCVAGVSDLIVVATPEAVIVLPRERAQDVKQLRELASRLA